MAGVVAMRRGWTWPRWAGRPRVAGVAGPLMAPGLALASMAFVQVGAAVSQGLFAVVGAAGTAWLRLSWAAVVLLAVARPSLRGRTRRDLGAVLALGVASAGLTLSFFEAIARIPLGIATTIEFLGPLGVALAGSRRPRDVAWVVLAGAGIALLADGAGGGLDPVGLAFAAVAGCCWAAYILLTQRVGRAFAGLGGLSLSMTVAAVVATPVGLAQAAGGLTPAVVIAAAGLALLLPVIPYALELAALRRLSARSFGVLMSLEPAIGVLVGLVVLGQSLGPVQIAAVVLVVLASAGATATER